MPAATAANTAQQPRKRRAEKHQPDRDDGGRQTQQPDVDTEDLRRGRYQRHQRRLIDITKIRMPAADQKIQLVALRIITTGGRRMHQRDQNGDNPDKRRM
ncbi:MAG: hypothetical protein ABI192_03955 [Bradyrhizobium sp.]